MMSLSAGEMTLSPSGERHSPAHFCPSLSSVTRPSLDSLLPLHLCRRDEMIKRDIARTVLHLTGHFSTETLGIISIYHQLSLRITVKKVPHTHWEWSFHLLLLTIPLLILFTIIILHLVINI